ncbi:MAG: peptide ABC transporter substrate-binding protein [Phycisphaerales bacterium]|nr:peptide ABC transporter substrate-binding protein [Phycisphaerales bacterium]
MKVLAPFVLVLAALAMVYWDDAPRRADLVFVNRGDVFTLDPQRMSYLQDFRIAYALYEGLVRWNNHDMSIEPAATAGPPEISDDLLTYTFHIRPQARWSNGDPVTAHDFIYSWQRLLWPDTAADYSNLLFVIDGAEEFFRWRTDQLAAHALGQQSLDAQQLLDEAQSRFEQTVALKAVGERILQIKLRAPTPYFLDLLCFAVCYPVHRPTVEGWITSQTIKAAIQRDGWHSVDEPPWADRRWLKVDPITGRLEQKHQWARPGELVSNGPYLLSEWRYKRDLRMERNPLYHDQPRIRSDSVLMVSIEDTNTTVLAFESGQIDWLSDVNAEYMADMLQERLSYETRYSAAIASLTLKGKSIDQALASLPPPDVGAGERRNIHSFPTFGTDFYNFNCRPTLADGRPNPFASAAVRRAFVLSVDKNAIVRNATRLNEPIATTLIPRGSIPNYHGPAGLPHHPTRARAELASAGWIDRNNDGLIESESGQPFPIIDLLWTTNTPRYKWISLELKSQWERELGVRVELRGADTKFYKEDLKLGKYMIARARWYGDYGDPTTFLDINKTGDGNNDRGYSNPLFDAALAAAANEPDSGKRLRLLEDAERLLMEEEVPLLPICQLVQVYMYEPGHLRGLTTHPRLVQYLWQIEAEPPELR